MRKSNNKVSQSKINRGTKIKRRKTRMNTEVNKRVIWLEHIVKAGEQLNMEKLIESSRSVKQAKLVIDRLVSRNVGQTMSRKKGK